MKPGRELDALIAEKVMGRPTERYAGAVVFSVDPNSIQGVYPLDYIVPHYSTDIAAAWEVVEKVYDWNFRLERFEGLSKDYYGAQFFLNGEWHYGEADTAPLAICLAALKAVTNPLET